MSGSTRDSLATGLSAPKATQAQHTAVIVQSCYIPWKGFFDLINLADEFILYDDVQYTRRDWRNRNLIKTATGLRWLTIPVEVKGRYSQAIKDTVISDPTWGGTHWKTITHNYAKAAHFKTYRDLFEPLFLERHESHLSEVNRIFLEAICAVLRIDTRISWSMDYELAAGKSERLLGLCKSVGCNRYLSGPSARDYLDVALFAREGVRVEFMDYSGYPEYHQLFGRFEHGVSVLDLLFNEGPEARRYMKTLRTSEEALQTGAGAHE